MNHIVYQKVKNILQANLSPEELNDYRDYLNQWAKEQVTNGSMTPLNEESSHYWETEQLHYRNLFDNAPISLWEADFSAVKIYLERLRQEGVTNFWNYFENHPESVDHCLRHIKILSVNQATCQLYQIADKTDLLDSFELVMDETARQSFASELAALAEGQIGREIEIETQSLQGKKIYICYKSVIMPGHENDWANVLISMYDITERKLTDDQFYQNKKRLWQMIDLVPHLIYARDRDGRFLFANQATASAFGTTPQELVGKFLQELHPNPAEAQETLKQGEKVIASGEPSLILKATFTDHAGTPRFYQVSKIPFKLLGSDKQGILNVSVDITARKRAEEALQQARTELEQRIQERTVALIESEQRYKRLLESITNYVYTVNIEDGQPVSTTHGPGCLAVTGYTPEEYAADIYLWHNMIHPADREAVTQRASKLIAGESVPPLEHRIIHKDGTTRWVQNRAIVHRDKQGAVVAYEGVIIDITARKQAEEAYRMLVEQSLQGLAILQDSRMIFANQALAEITGYSVEELIAMSAEEFGQIIHPDDQALAQERLQTRMEGKYVPVGFGFRFIRKDMTVRWVEAFASPVEYRGQPAMQTAYLDITSRKQVEQEKDRLFEAVSRQREQLRALSGRLAEAQEAERKQLSRELHDQVGQNLTALGFNLNLIYNQLRADCPIFESLQTRLTDSLLLVEETSDRIYNVMADLRPPVLDDYGLVAAFKWYGQQWTKRTGLSIAIEGEEPAPRLASPIENALFRIAQEALTNIAKHAHANHVLITVKDGETMTLVIKDDGVGFDWTNLMLYTERQHWGLITMRERAEAIGGHCEVESQPEQGTQVIVKIPRASF